jgi:hypothetical protein
MSSKKPSFRDILRNSFPVDVDGLLGEKGEDHLKKNVVATEAAVSPQDTVAPTDTVAHSDTVANEATVARSDTVPPDATVSPPHTVSPPATVSSLETVSQSEHVELTSNYFIIDADVFDLLPKFQTPIEQLIYLHLYRESHGRRSRICFIGLKSLIETCQLSKNTVRKALESLEEKGHIRRLERFNDRNHKGTLYRVFLPCEISGIQSQTTFKLSDD